MGPSRSTRCAACPTAAGSCATGSPRAPPMPPGAAPSSPRAGDRGVLRLCPAVTVAGTGCASQLSLVKSEPARLRGQVTQLRADKRRSARTRRHLETEIAATDGGDRGALGAGGEPALPVTL